METENTIEARREAEYYRNKYCKAIARSEQEYVELIKRNQLPWEQ